MISEIIFDVETKTFFDETGDFDPRKLGVSIVSLYRRKLDEDFKEVEGEIMSFWEKDFEEMWTLFSEADRIVGYNSVRFDVPALSPYTSLDLSKLPHFDILDIIKKTHGKRVSLNRVAKSTLGRSKIDEAKNATVYWASQKPSDLEKLKRYCEEDVLLTKDIYDFGLHRGFLNFTNYWNSPFTVKIDFSYPPKFIPKSASKQTQLF